MYFAMGIAVTMVAAWSLSAWRASAAVSPDESTFVNVSPTRILDTREDIGLAGPFVSAVPQDLKVTGSIATKSGTIVVVPDGATGVTLNVTAVGPTAAGFLSIRPADAPGVPTTSSLNFNAGDIIPNSVTVQVPTSGADAGKIEITYDAFGQSGPTTEILVDLVGYTKNAGLASLQAQVNALQAVVNAATAPGAVGSTEIAPDAVGPSEIAPDAVGSTEIAPDAVGPSEIAPGAVGASEIAPGTINNTHIVNNSLTALNLGPDSVGASELVDHTVGLSEMRASLQEEILFDASGPFAIGVCSPDIFISAPGAVAGSRTLMFLNRMNLGTVNPGWIISGGIAAPVVNDQASVRVCNVEDPSPEPPAMRISYITLAP
jgi:hypothetical protein